MKASFIIISSATYLLSTAGNALTLFDSPSKLKQLSQQPLDAEFLIITMNTPQIFSTIGYDKKFRIWKIEEENLNLKYCCSFPKKLTHGSSTLFDSKEYCFITDKYGDVYMIDVEKAIASNDIEGKMIRQDFIGPNTNGDSISKFIMGHQEAINLLLINTKFLITIDGANKIKVSKVPKFYEIYGIHFGHHEEIIFAKLLNDFTLLTIDKKREAIVWNIEKDEDALMFRGTLGLGNVININVIEKNIIAVTGDDKHIEFYEIDDPNKKFELKEKKPIPENLNCISILDNKGVIIVGINEKTQEIQLSNIET